MYININNKKLINFIISYLYVCNKYIVTSIYSFRLDSNFTLMEFLNILYTTYKMFEYLEQLYRCKLSILSKWSLK